MTLTEISGDGPSNRLEKLGAASAGVVHDINNQLMLIMNHLVGGDVSAALRSASVCAALTGSILDYCRDARPALGAVDLSRVVAETAAGLNVPSSTHLRLELNTESLLVLADPTGLTRILHNLVSNATAAMDGFGTIIIAVAGNELRVSDTGPGIPMEQRKQIFEPFYSTKAGRTAKGGTGLGLAIVSEIMRHYGGSVEVDSVPGRGAMFTLRFCEAVRLV